MQIYSLLTVASLASVCFATVWTTSPTADTRWPIGGKAELTWKIKSPSKGTEQADIYLVGGNYQAYRRLETLGKGVTLSSKKLVIESVPKVDCGGSCAIEFFISSDADFYSHNFTIAPAAELQPAPSTSGGTGSRSTSSGGNGSGVMPGATSQQSSQNLTAGAAAGFAGSWTSAAATGVMTVASIALSLL